MKDRRSIPLEEALRLKPGEYEERYMTPRERRFVAEMRPISLAEFMRLIQQGERSDGQKSLDSRFRDD